MVATYLLLMQLFHTYLRPDQLFLVLALASVAILGKEGGKRFITDWAPFTFFIILYDGMRGIADGTFGDINVRGPYILEKYLFGWITGGDVFPFWLQWWRNSIETAPLANILNGLAGMLYTIHFLAPFVFGWLLWHTYNDRRSFYAFAYSLTILNVMALITFLLYPTAPPWYVWKYHFAVPDISAFNYGDPSVLIKIDELIKLPLFSSIYSTLNPNAFAAIPSLHAAYPLMIAIFAFMRWKNPAVRALMVVYVTVTWLAACYLNHHYLIDLIIGAAYTVASLVIYRRFVDPYIIGPLVFRRAERHQTTGDRQTSEGQGSGIATLTFGIGGIILIVLILAHARGYF